MILAVALPFLLAVPPVAGAAGPTTAAEKPTALVEQVLADAMTLLIRDRQRLARSSAYGRHLIRELVLPHTDTRRMARFALGPDWDRASPAQRQRFTRAFTAQMVQTYGTALHQYASEIAEFARTTELSYRLLSESGRRATVRIGVAAATTPSVTVDLLMHRYDGPWKVFDIQVAGISILLTYRASLATQLLLSDLDTVIRRLEEKTGTGAS